MVGGIIFNSINYIKIKCNKYAWPKMKGIIFFVETISFTIN